MELKHKVSIIVAIIGLAGSLGSALIGYKKGGEAKELEVSNTATQIFNIENVNGDLQNLLADVSEDIEDKEVTIEGLEAENLLLNSKVEALTLERDRMEEEIARLKELAVQNNVPDIEEDEGSKTALRSLFDTPPYVANNVHLYMINNDMSSVYRGGFYYSYNSDYSMKCAGEPYNSGMAITVDSQKTAEIYFNLSKEYLLLTGKIGFEDSNIDRVDSQYEINFLRDGENIGSYQIVKGDIPQEVVLDVSGGQVLVIEFIKPGGDISKDPNINLLEFYLH